MNRPTPPRRLAGHGVSGLVVTAAIGALLLVARPASALGLPDPSLPIALPSVPLPTLALPTLPPLPVPTVRLPTVPPLPLPTVSPPTLPPPPTRPPLPTLVPPTPTLPVPTPTLSIPTPSLPVGTARPAPSPSPSAALAGASPGASPGGGAGPSPGTLSGASAVPVDASTGPSAVDAPIVGSGSGSSLGSLVVPGLILGIPAILVLGILAAQLAVGVAWLPVIRRWLGRRL